MQKRYWLRGGLIALGLYFFAGVVLSFLDFGQLDSTYSGFLTVLYFIGPGQYVFGIDGPIEFIPSFILTVMLYFGAGTLLGYLYSKNKKIGGLTILSIVIAGALYGYLKITEYGLI